MVWAAHGYAVVVAKGARRREPAAESWFNGGLCRPGGGVGELAA
jgi:hypothetical protein